ncbi:uncharacterized protein LOC131690931 [Topomyia yanbarensis]|uniref:uncharacterized protein LOC131690931 n=1 Tax=Topomyia yanbarensis TaxID=2498891 RepID=UPI00273ADD9A|nr:uncharacterized protein LOC131690931 [Topomyia yanbarensis]
MEISFRMHRSQCLIITVAYLLLPFSWAQQHQQAFSLLKRCPCVPINTCYSEEASLNVQQYLNDQFRCPEFTHQHCCGPVYPTLGHPDEQLKTLKADAVNPPSDDNVIVIVAESVTPKQEVQSRSEEVMTVLPQTEGPIFTEATTSVDNEDSATETSTVLVEDTTTPLPVTTTTVQSPTRRRLNRFHQRRLFPKHERSSTESTSARDPIRRSTTSSTTESSRRLPTRKSLYNTEFQQRYVPNRQRKETTTTTESLE